MASSHSKHQRHAAGFTLLELLVALTIFAIMAALAYGGLSSILRTRSTVANALKRTRTWQQAMLTMRTDLSQVRPRPVRGNYGDPKPDFLLDPQTGQLIFTRGGYENPVFMPRSTLQRVAYALEDDKLVRYHWQVLDRAQDSQPARTLLVSGITAMSWRFLDADGQWRDTPTADDANRVPNTASANLTPTLPRAAELTLKTDHWGNLQYVFLVSP